MPGVRKAWTTDNHVVDNFYKEETNVKSKTPSKTEDQHCIVWGALFLVMRLSRLMGAAPVKFEKGKDGVRMSLSPYWSIWSYSIAFGLTTIITTTFILDTQLSKQSSVRNGTQMACVISATDLTILLFIMITGTYGATTRIKEMIACIGSINLIMKNLNNNRPFVEAEIARCAFIITWVSGSILLFLCDMYVYIYKAVYNDVDKLVVGLNIFAYVALFTLQVLELQCVFMAMLIETALSKINGELRDLILVNDCKYVRRSAEVKNNSSLESLDLLNNLVTIMDINSFANILPSSRSANSSLLIHRLILAYTGVCDIARQFYRSNGVLLISFLMWFLINLVVTSYYFVSYLYSVEQNTGTKIGRYLQFLWFMHNATELFLLMEPGHRILEEIARTKILIGQLMNRVDLRNGPLTSELELFQRQIALNTVTCSLLGICVLTRPLIATVLSGLTTYYVIVIQFKSKEK